MNVGELRAALEGAPDDMPLEVLYDGGHAGTELSHVKVDVEHFILYLVGD